MEAILFCVSNHEYLHNGKLLSISTSVPVYLFIFDIKGTWDMHRNGTAVSWNPFENIKQGRKGRSRVGLNINTLHSRTYVINNI